MIKTRFDILHCVKLAFLVAQTVKNLPANAGDPSLILGSERSPGEGKENPLQCSCLDLADHSSWGHKELDMIEQLAQWSLNILSYKHH